MPIAAILLVLASGLLHAVWNMNTKKSGDKYVFLWFCQLAALLLFLPWTIAELPGVEWTGTAVLLTLLSMLLHGAYVVLLAAAYNAGDLSQVYPIMRGTGPLLVPVAGVLLLGESLAAAGWLGVGAVTAGIILLSGVKLRAAASVPLRAPLIAFAVGCCVSAYIVTDKIALDHLPPVVLNEATNAGNLLALSWAAFRAGNMRRELRTSWRTILLGGLIAPGGYLLFLYAMTLAPAALLTPMREIGTVFGTVLGVVLLKERHGARRFAASALVTAGVVLLGSSA